MSAIHGIRPLGARQQRQAMGLVVAEMGFRHLGPLQNGLDDRPAEAFPVTLGSSCLGMVK